MSVSEISARSVLRCGGGGSSTGHLHHGDGTCVRYEAVLRPAAFTTSSIHNQRIQLHQLIDRRDHAALGCVEALGSHTGRDDNSGGAPEEVPPAALEPLLQLAELVRREDLVLLPAVEDDGGDHCRLDALRRGLEQEVEDEDGAVDSRRPLERQI